MPCPRTQHRNNVPILWGEKHDISLKILHQVGFETAQQAATLTKFRALTIVPRPSLKEKYKFNHSVAVLHVMGEVYNFSRWGIKLSGDRDCNLCWTLRHTLMLLGIYSLEDNAKQCFGQGCDHLYMIRSSNATFAPTWIYVSLTRPTTSSGRKLLICI